jgi:hypothetical protein
MGDGLTPLYQSYLNYNPSDPSFDNQVNQSYDVEELLEITGIQPKLNDTTLFKSFFTRPLLETNLVIQDKSGIPIVYKHLNFIIEYGYIPQKNTQYVQVVHNEPTLPTFIVKDQSNNSAFAFKGTFTKEFGLNDRIQLIAQKYLNHQIFDHWEDYLSGISLSLSTTYLLKSNTGYTILRPVYKNLAK